MVNKLISMFVPLLAVNDVSTIATVTRKQFLKSCIVKKNCTVECAKSNNLVSIPVDARILMFMLNDVLGNL